MGEFPSGQRGQTVNLLSLTSVVRIHLPPPENPMRMHRVFNSIRLRRVILLRSDIRLTPSDIGLRPVKGTNRMSLRVKRAISLSAQAENITSSEARYFTKTPNPPPYAHPLDRYGEVKSCAISVLRFTKYIKPGFAEDRMNKRFILSVFTFILLFCLSSCSKLTGLKGNEDSDGWITYNGVKYKIGRAHV